MDEKRIEEIINKASQNAAQLVREQIQVDIDTASSNAARLVREQMQGDFRAFGEGLQALRDKVNSIDSRLTRVEDKLDVVEILSKNTFKEVQNVKQIVSVHEKKLAKV
jgi:hypothetical protein